MLIGSAAKEEFNVEAISTPETDALVQVCSAAYRGVPRWVTRLSGIKTMFYIILPQAVRYVLPAVGNELIALLKETSVAGYVAVMDLTKAGNQIRNTTYDSINPILLVALVYLALVMIMTYLLSVVERRLRNSER